ncbi:outer membrane beta-barrel family protein [Kaistella palustris]|uniref:outer membrane beta-barrel family protein n=1 Tax=Kaistella palustris TaxID=493376 RepID=UPI000401113D|nr:outer membrane beta-barrel protein [Kaistella palustris]
MKFILFTALFFCSAISTAQTKHDSIKQKNLQEVVVIGRKPTVESKADRTVFNVANSSVLSGNTTWEVLRMTPLVSIDNNDVIRAEGESVTVYINDRKSIFSGKELKEYLQTVPAENLMKIEVITSPSAKYETAGEVINIVLKKLLNEGVKGSLTFNNSQNAKNSQYSNLNINYHKGNFTQSISGSYSDNTRLSKSESENFIYNERSLTKISTESTELGKSPSFSTAAELELNEKNTIGLISEFAQNNRNSFASAFGTVYADGNLQNFYSQEQNLSGYNRNLGNNIFYKYYDKEKNKILDLNAGFNYDSNSDTNDHILNRSNTLIPSGNRIMANNENREYYLKADYSQPLGKSESQLEFGGKIDFRNNVIPYGYFSLSDNSFVYDGNRSNNFHYSENLNSVYMNFSKTYFQKLETRIGLRYEYIYYKIRQDVGGIERTDSYGTFLPNLLLKYTFSENYNLSATYNHNLWRPWYSEFNPFLLPNDDGTFYRGNLELQPNPSDRIGVKLGLFKKYFVSANYSFTDRDYWDSYFTEDGKTISMPVNFNGKSERYSFNLHTNQTFLKNKLNINLNFGLTYSDNSDFNKRNDLEIQSYFTNLNGSSNISYTNLFNKDININAWVGVFTQNNGNTFNNKPNVFHNMSATKIFKKLGLETTLRLVNPFAKLKFDNTTYAPIGTFRNRSQLDYHGISVSIVKRFGNQKVKENTKTDVEKESGGGKN